MKSTVDKLPECTGGLLLAILKIRQVLAESGQKFLELSGYFSLYCYSFSQIALFFEQLGNFFPVLVIFSLNNGEKAQNFSQGAAFDNLFGIAYWKKWR